MTLAIVETTCITETNLSLLLSLSLFRRRAFVGQWWYGNGPTLAPEWGICGSTEDILAHFHHLAVIVVRRVVSIVIIIGCVLAVDHSSRSFGGATATTWSYLVHLSLYLSERGKLSKLCAATL